MNDGDLDKEKVLANGTVPPEYKDKIVDAIRFTLPKKQVLLKSQWATLLILANFNWDRPIYFATSIGNENYLGLTNYFRLEGFAYRLVPYKAENSSNQYGEYGSIYTPILYDNVMNKFKWGRINEPDFNVDNYVDRTAKVMNIRSLFHRLADALINENKLDSAKQVLDKAVEVMPDNKFPFDYFFVPIIGDYYRIGEVETANALAAQTLENYKQKVDFFVSLKPEMRNGEEVQRELQIAYFVFQQLYDYLNKNNQDTLANQAQQYMVNTMNYIKM
jgi:tetratricopeptide (TPR) repeat protein